MRILITGGLGYLGGRIAQYLLQETIHEVIIATRKVNNSYTGLEKAKLTQVQWESLSNLTEICNGMDIIIHAAGINAESSKNDPAAALDFNGVTTAELLQAAIKKNVKKFIHVSTAHVYGSPLKGEINEQSCTNSTHPYATSHHAGEDVVRYAHEQGNIEGVVLRLSNACGAPLHKNVDCWMLIVNDLCRQAVINKELSLNSSGNQYRNFITMSDVINGILHFINLPLNHFENSVFNLGGIETIRIIDVAKIIATRCDVLFGYTPEINHPKAPKNEDEAKFDYQVSKLLKTGYSYTGDIVSEIDQTLEFCQKEFGNFE